MQKELIPMDLSHIKIKEPDRLNFGPAGIPLKTLPRKTLNSFHILNRLELGAMELEFVRNITLNPATAKEILDTNNGQVLLTCHGSYFINLNSEDKETVIASKGRIIQGAMMARQAGAWSMTFHAAFYKKDDKSIVYDRVKEQLKDIVSQLKDAGNEIWIRPETTGKASQFGTIQETIQLSAELDNVMPCIDFAHLHARTNGKYNTTEEFREVLTMIEQGLGRRGLDNMHIHMSGINYGTNGEKNHLVLEESDFNWRELLNVWKEFKIKGAVINESPNLEEDALLMQQYWKDINKNGG